MKIRQFLEKYHENKLGKTTRQGNYKVEKGKLLYTGKGRMTYVTNEEPELLATTLKDGTKLYNASRLQKCGTHRRGAIAPIQKHMIDLKLPMIPFNVLQETKTDINKAKIIQKGKEEQILMPKQRWNETRGRYENVLIKTTVYEQEKGKSTKTRKLVKTEKAGNAWRNTYITTDNLEKRHFIGAILLRIGKKTYLFDIDRNEVKHYRMNVFLTQVKGEPKTIKAAYQALKPKQVTQAEKNKLKVKRQGEWFFIPRKGIKEPKEIEEVESEQYDMYVEPYETIKALKRSSHYKRTLPKYRKMAEERFKDMKKEYERREALKGKDKVFRYGGELQAGNNRPNDASKMMKKNGKTYVKGRISHTGREHEDLNLKEWHEAIPNTAINSFTITGDID